MAVNVRELSISAMGKGLGVGEQLSGQLCPFCSSSDKSFSLTRERTGYVYNCHRNSCNVRGYIRTEPADEDSRPQVKGNSSYARWLRSLVPLVEEQRDWLWNKWKMDKSHTRKGGIEFSLGAQRLSIPIFDREGKQVGVTFRSLGTASAAKSLICMTDMNALCMSFYEGALDPHTVIIVEDQASAIRASSYCSSVALLGVSMDGVRAAAIAKTCPSRVIFCLDKDAFARSVELAKKWGAMMKKHTTVCPPKDLKDMTEEELQDFLYNTCNLEKIKE